MNPILHRYYAKEHTFSVNAEVTAHELLQRFFTEFPVEEGGLFSKIISVFFSEAGRTRKWDALSRLTGELELLKRSVRQADRYAKLSRLITQLLEKSPDSPVQWIDCKKAIHYLKENLNVCFSTETAMAKRNALKP